MKFTLKNGLLLGTATAATQIEGGDDNNNWARFAREGKVDDGTSPTRACDHYNRWREDIDLMADMGMQIYRFGIEWSRIEPEQGEFDYDVLDHYREEIEYMIKKGIKPLLTLHHFSNPLWFEDMASVLQKDLGVFCSINLYNIGQGWDQKSRDTYEKYVDFCFEQLDPNVYCYDMYPHSSDPGNVILNKVLWNMALFRDRALKAGKPYWTYLAAGGQWLLNTVDSTKKPYFPNEPQFNWYYNAHLAFGCQGFIYYSFVHELKSTTVVGTDWDHYEKGMLGEFGNKNQWYYYAQNANKHIAAVDDVLMNSVNKGVIASSKNVKDQMQFIDCVIESGKFQELQSVSGDALVGCFNYNGKTALYVVNFSLEYAQKIELEFNESQKLKVVQNAETSYRKGESLTLDMAAGEGVLLVIE